MSGLERLQDFLRWLREVEANLSQPKPPRAALGVSNDAAVLLRRAGPGYDVDRPVKSGDRGPVYLNDTQILASEIKVSPEAALYGRSAARIDAAKACPFELEPGCAALSPSPAAWTDDGATWRLAAAPKARITDMRTALTAAGARPGGMFAMVAGRPVSLTGQRRSVGLALGAGLVVFAVIGAVVSVTYAAGRIEAEAEMRLSEARRALSAAEDKAAAALAAREAATGPLRQAQIVGAALENAPSVAARLAQLSAATPDTAYLKRLTITPTGVTGDYVAPDAAALAAAISAAPGFASARLKGPARAAAAGLQRATLDITPEATP